MKEVNLELHEENAEFLHELAARKNATPSEVITELLQEQEIIRDFGSMENFEKIIAEAEAGPFYEVNDEFWARLKAEIFQDDNNENKDFQPRQE